MTDIGIVVIGRNEGKRLHRCLRSVVGLGAPVVYVDSGSTDGSVALARSMGFDVVELDPSQPFTAARARNTGFETLLESDPELEFVQFVDGDCEMAAGWLQHGLGALCQRADVALVCGRVRELHPEASVFNSVCDIEWDLPVGEIEGCGGNMLLRVQPLRNAGGFDPTIVAAEDTELCCRLRQQGWKILHVAADMVRHDAAMMHVGQWWRRCFRAGHAFAQFSGPRDSPTSSFFARNARSVWFWACLVPILSLTLTWPSRGLSLILFAGYPTLVLRIYRRLRRKQTARRDAIAYASHCVLAKFPQALGMLQYHLNRWRGRPSAIIEHKIPRSGQECRIAAGGAIQANEDPCVGVHH